MVQAPSIIPSSVTRNNSIGKELLLEFISKFLEVHIIGFQSGFGVRSDLILFFGPTGSTLAVPTSTMLLPREEALQVIQERVRKAGL